MGEKYADSEALPGRRTKKPWIYVMQISTLRSNEMQDTQTLRDGIVGGKGIAGEVEDRRKRCIVIIIIIVIVVFEPMVGAWQI